MKQIPEISPTFCVSPWMETTLTSNSLLCLCCYAHPIRDKEGRAYNLVEDSLEDFWNGDGIKEVRSKMLIGEKVSACQFCYYDESIGKFSRRQEINSKWLKSEHYGSYTEDILDRVEKSRTNGYKVEKPPLRLDIRPTNLCNLKCRMCNPQSSSKIEREQKELLESAYDTNVIEQANHFDNSGIKKFSNWGGKQDKKRVWKSIYSWSSGIKNIYFTGGEPTLIKEIWDFIDYLKEKNLAKDITLEFNTNCTQNPKKLIGTFDSFHSVEILFSVDGYKEVNDYIRFPSKWVEIENNIIKMLDNKRENIGLFFAPVIQIYNILDLPRLLKWVNDLSCYYNNHFLKSITLTGPDFLHIDILPRNVKERALLKLEQISFLNENNLRYFSYIIDPIKNILRSEEKHGIERHLKNFYKYTKLLDQHRGNNFEQTFPELNGLLNEDGRWKT